MNKLKEIIYSQRGKYLISILIGFGLATLFRGVCKSRNCLLFKAPSLDKVKEKIFSYNKKCYKFSEKNTSCTDLPNNKILDIEDTSNE